MNRFVCFAALLSLLASSGSSQVVGNATNKTSDSHWRDYLQEELVVFVTWDPNEGNQVKIMLQSKLDNMAIEASRSDVERCLKRKAETMIKQLRQYVPDLSDAQVAKLRLAAKVDRNRFLRNTDFRNGIATLKPSLEFDEPQGMRIHNYLRDPCGENTMFKKVFESQTRTTESGLRSAQ